MYYTPPQFYSIYKHALTSRVENSVDHDQLASEKPADLDPHCFQKQGIFWFNIARVRDSSEHGICQFQVPLQVPEYIRRQTEEEFRKIVDSVDNAAPPIADINEVQRYVAL